MPSTHDLIVLGAGSGGLATAFRAARHGARVALLEPGELGGTCVNVGCVPKKAMWFAAQMADAQQLARSYGFDVEPGPLDWPAFVARRQGYIDGIHASYRKRLDEAGIEVVPAHGRFENEQAVVVDGRRLQAPHIVIATGAHSRQLDVPGFELGIDSDGFFDLQACPRRVAVIGGGYIATELAGVLHALGAEVDVLARSHLLRGFDAELTEALAQSMREQGIGVHGHCQARGLRRDEQGLRVDCGAAADVANKTYDSVLWAVGRVPNSSDLGLDEVGVARDADGHVQVDAMQDTTVPGIHAIGDVTARPALTPVAIAAGRQLAERLFGGRDDAHLDYDNIPSVVFSHPPLASVGLDEDSARERHGDDVRCYHSRFRPMQLALADIQRKALMKLVCVGDEERVVGVHMLGPGVDEMVQGFAVAVKMGARKADFDATVAVHPTAAEELVLMG
ncbi:MAG TPA: glutathione-disulfide reductase [Oleiagrimonas sp.]|nr:glutathione-disulfide reductase [Oleiagrimonas sp.]